jgi:hypothetical protein
VLLVPAADYSSVEYVCVSASVCVLESCFTHSGAVVFVRVAFMLVLVSRRFLGCVAVLACSHVVWMSSFSLFVCV